MSDRLSEIADKPDTGQMLCTLLAKLRRMSDEANQCVADLHAAVEPTNIALRYIRQHKATGNNEMLWHLGRIEQILLGNDDGKEASNAKE